MIQPSRSTLICAAAAIIIMQTNAAMANDSTAALDAGGLRLTSMPSISLDNENLYLSRSRVRVIYRFRNTSTSDVSTLVAFPLPAMEIGEGGNYAFPSEDPINVVDFQVTVDGRRIDPKVEIKATRFGVDVTDVLKRYNIPVTMRTQNPAGLEARLNSLPADARRELEQHGIIDWSNIIGPDDKPSANPHWDTQITFYWFQTFPAGRTIEVTHSYRPVPRQFFLTTEELTSAGRKNAYCFDDAFVRSARVGIEHSPQKVLLGYELKYILTTAGNWAGPIGNFALTVEKSGPNALVSLCGSGFKRASPTAYSVSKQDFSPLEDLKVLFVEPSAPAN